MQKFCVGHVHLIYFASISFALGSVFQWNMGFRVLTSESHVSRNRFSHTSDVRFTMYFCKILDIIILTILLSHTRDVRIMTYFHERSDMHLYIF